MSGDAGLSLIEILVAILLLSGALIGTAGEVAGAVKHQVVEHSQVDANHLADSWFEYAESLERSATAVETSTGGVATTIATANPPITTANVMTTKIHGVTFTETTTPYICTPANLASSSLVLSSCNGTVSPTNTIFSQIHITWSIGGQSHQLTLIRNLSDNSIYNAADTTDPSANGLTTCTRAQVSGTSVTINSFTITPTTTTTRTVTNTGRAYVDGTSGYPTKDENGTSMTTLAVSLRETGLVNNSDTGISGFGPPNCIPLLWTDSTGTHQVDLHASTTGDGGCAFASPASTTYKTTACTWTASIPSSDITVTNTASFPVGSSPWQATVPFCAYYLSSGGCPAGTGASGTNFAFSPFYVSVAPGFGTCSEGALGINTISTFGTHRVGALGASVQCSGLKNITSASTMTVTYPTNAAGSNFGTTTLTNSNNGANWSGTIPSGTTVFGSSTLQWVFTVKRTADGTFNTKSITVSVS